MKKADINDIKVLWNYLRLVQVTEHADCIICFGSHDEHVAVKAAQLYLEGFAENIIFTGGRGRITEKLWQEPEAVHFARIAEEMGVPEGRIFIEAQSKNTGENIEITRSIVEGLDFGFEKYIAVDKPYKLRRMAGSLRSQWKGIRFTVASEDVSCEEYLLRFRGAEMGVGPKDVVNLMTGEISRLKKYAWKGFIEPDEIPDEVNAAYRRLLDAGYNGCCV